MIQMRKVQKLSVAIDAKVKMYCLKKTLKNIFKMHTNSAHILKATRGNIDVDLNVQVVD